MASNRFRARMQARQRPAAATPAPAADAQPHDLLEVLEHSVDFVVQTDPLGAITYLNPAARQVLGLAANGALAGLNFSHFAAPGTRRQFAEQIVPALLSRAVWVGETTLRLGPGRAMPLSLMALAHRDQNGRPLRFSAVMRDITAEVEARRQIQRQNQILSAITEALPATVVIIDSQGRYRFANSAFERQVGRDAAHILGHTAGDVLGPEEVARRRPYMQQAFAGQAVSFTLDHPGAHGTTYLAMHCIPLKLDGVVDGFVGISQDVTPQRREEERLTHLAERDPLTGLLNRAGFERRVERRLRSGDGPAMALLYIDLDRFKPVNDQHGHLVGDQLLQQFARRLSESVRGSDLVARLGGDEFAVLLAGLSDGKAAEVIADKVLVAAARPFCIDALSVAVSASIGVAVQCQAEGDWRELVARADRLLYQAKAAGRGRRCAQAQTALTAN